MQALVIRNENGKCVPYLENVDVPECKENEVLIEVQKVGICGSDFHLFTPRGFSGAQSFPQIIGHEFSGTVVKTGNSVSGFCAGDVIASESVVTCGKCSDCSIINRMNCGNAELIGFTKPGAYAQYICIDYRHIHKIDKLISRFGTEKGFLLGSLLEPLGCAYKAIFLVNKNHDFKNKNFVIWGAGPIGLGAAWLLSTITEANVFLIDENKQRLTLAKNMNCKTINAHISDEFLNSGILPKIDFLFETSGALLDFDRLVPFYFNSDATMIYISRNAVKFNVSMDTFVSNDFCLIGSRGHRGAFPKLIDFMVNNDVENLLDIVEPEEVALSDLPEILVNSENFSKGKIIVNLKK